MNINLDDIYIGMELPKLYKNPSTRQLVQYAGASFDYYEIHYDKDVAQKNIYQESLFMVLLKQHFLENLSLNGWNQKENY